MELNGSGRRYGYDETRLHQTMLDHGFQPFSYRPFTRELIALDSTSGNSGNMLYLKNASHVAERVRSASAFQARGRQI